MVYPAFSYTTAEEYLLMESNAVERHEYFSGAVYAMAGATERHNIIVLNIGGELYNYLKGKECKAYLSDFRVATAYSDNYMYPDLSLVCGKTELKPNCFDTLTNPKVIFEVLNPSTDERDRVLNIFFYRQIPSLEEYILVETEQCMIAVFRKMDDDSWEEFVTNGLGSTLLIKTIEMHLPQKEIYARTIFTVKS